jgi:hypothetical protein
VLTKVKEENTMKCKVCNADIVEGANFCLMCGAKVEREIFCSQCGTKLPEGSRFCFSCGAKVDINGAGNNVAASVTENANVTETVDVKENKNEQVQEIVENGYTMYGYEGYFGEGIEGYRANHRYCMYKDDLYFVANKHVITGERPQHRGSYSFVEDEDSSLVKWSSKEKCLKIVIEEFDDEFTIFDDKIYRIDWDMDDGWKMVVLSLQDGKELERININKRCARATDDEPSSPILINSRGEWIFYNGKEMTSQSGKKIPGKCRAYNDKYMYVCMG